MPLTQKIISFVFASTLITGLGGCVIAPVQQGAYRAAPVYVESYPGFRHGYSGANVYYESDHRRYDDRGGNYYRGERHQEEHRFREPRQSESPLESAVRAHRDIRRSLGLPRLPGMP